MSRLGRKRDLHEAPVVLVAANVRAGFRTTFPSSHSLPMWYRLARFVARDVRDIDTNHADQRIEIHFSNDGWIGINAKINNKTGCYTQRLLLFLWEMCQKNKDTKIRRKERIRHRSIVRCRWFHRFLLLLLLAYVILETLDGTSPDQIESLFAHSTPMHVSRKPLWVFMYI